MNARNLSIVFAPNVFDIAVNEFSIENSKKVLHSTVIHADRLLILIAGHRLAGMVSDFWKIEGQSNLNEQIM